MIFTIINKLTFRRNEGSRQQVGPWEDRFTDMRVGSFANQDYTEKHRRLKNAKEKISFIFHTSLLKFKEVNSEL